MSWILLTLNCRGQKVQVLMMASLSPSNSHRVSDFPQLLSGMNELILELQSSALFFLFTLNLYVKELNLKWIA